MQPLVLFMDRVNGFLNRGKKMKVQPPTVSNESQKQKPTGTFTLHITPEWLKERLTGKVDFQIRVWRSVSVRFLRSVIQPWFFGKLWLRLLFWLEDRYPVYYGENGQYPMIIIRKPSVTNK
jgi:hypothetical protein